MKTFKIGDKFRIKHQFGSDPKGYLIHIVAIVDKIKVVYKWYGHHKQWWHYGIEDAEIIKIWIERSK
jgi:hypothetical protein